MLAEQFRVGTFYINNEKTIIVVMQSFYTTDHDKYIN